MLLIQQLLFKFVFKGIWLWYFIIYYYGRVAWRSISMSIIIDGVMFFILWFVFALKNVAWKQTVTGEKFRITRGRPLKFALKLLIVYWIIVFRFRFEFRFCLGVLLVWGLWSSTSFSFSPCFWVRFCCRGWSFPLGLTWDFFLESTLFLWIRENTTFLVGSLVTVSNFVLCCLFFHCMVWMIWFVLYLAKEYKMLCVFSSPTSLFDSLF